MRKFPSQKGTRLCQLGSVLIALSLYPGCGGKTSGPYDLQSGSGGRAQGDGDGEGDLGDGDGDPGTGGRSTGGAVGGGSAVSSGGTPAAGGGSSLGTGGAAIEVCDGRLEQGPCDAAFTRYGFDHATGKCTQFLYGGCGGNENNFETLEECYDTCLDGQPGPEQACAMAAECMLIYKGCCGACGPGTTDDFWAINRDYEGDGPWAQMACDGVLCAECPSEASPEVGVTCENNRCTAFDIKRFAECEEDSDCRVRCGASCCGGGPPWVALSDVAGLEQLVCAPTMSCRSCVEPPEAPDAFCDDGICRVNQ